MRSIHTLFERQKSILDLSTADKGGTEILVLRQQLAILQRKQEKPVKPNRAEKMMLAVLTAKLKEVTQRPVGHLRGIIRIFQPETVLGWHRELVRRKWSYARKNKGGRPHIDHERAGMILR